jgi:F-type H+-transporting ATPase subunit alpha
MENNPISFHKQAVMIYAGVKWYLDKIDIENVAKYEQLLYEKLDTIYLSLSEKILTEKKLTEEIEGQIKILVQEVAEEI